MSNTIEIENFEEVMEDINKPLIPEGEFLAVVTAAIQHESAATPGNFSIKWSVTVNLSEDTEEWDYEGRTITLMPDVYTPLYNTVDGEKVLSGAFWRTVKMAKALSIMTKGTIDLDDVVGRTFIIKIQHEADNRQTEQQIEEDGKRWSARMQRPMPFTNDDGEQAPKLEAYITDGDDEEITEGDTEF